MKRILLSAFTLGALLLACSEPMTVTEKLRTQLEPRIGGFIVEAQRAYERGNYTIALAWTDSAEAYAPELADLHYLRGVIYTQLNQLDVARAAYETVLELDPRYQGARFNLGINEFRRGKVREAVDFYKDELELGETSSIWHEMGRAYASMNEADSAETAYLRAIQLDSTNATAIMWLGQLYEEIGEMDKAISYSQRGLRLRPENPDYAYIVGSLLHRNGQTAEAYAVLQPMADSRPWHQGAQFNMGQVLMAMGREADAKAYFAKADTAQQLQQKINEAQESINRYPTELERWTELAELLRRAGQIDRAADAYKVAVTLDPYNLYLQSNLALLLMEMGETEDALRRFRAIVRIDSNLTDVWFNLGVAYANTGRYDEARAAWQRVARRQPRNAMIRESLARLDQMQAEARTQASASQ
jgi:tetratricopeptide (TPR) repeat protein